MLEGKMELAASFMEDIEEHLLCDGINKNYTTWIWHDELTDM